jgi:NADH-quinone oxidoreductase subunit M
MVFFGAFRDGPASLQFSSMQVATIFALWGVVISAIYMLRAYRAVFMGPPGTAVAGWPDLTQPQRWPVILLVAVLMAAGFVPQYFLSFLTPPLQALLR